jgi:hypothetical protein
MQPTATFHFKFEDNRLFVRSKDGESWAPMSAENETSFFVKGQEEYRFIFVRDGTGTVTALQLMYQGIQMPLAKKLK